MAHTPGPWSLKLVPGDRDRVLAGRAVIAEVTRIGVTDNGPHDNGHLIAAAPDLLEAAYAGIRLAMAVSCRCQGCQDLLSVITTAVEKATRGQA